MFYFKYARDRDYAKFPDLVNFVTEKLEQLPEVVHNSLIQTITTISIGAADEYVCDKHLQLIFETTWIRKISRYMDTSNFISMECCAY
ncbi:hypothetical protein VTP01DRAFT_1431 [Rhizomucor pusillus]|uniref:uncharacterized protein n=1 Tax=Rhizomucor pusillus TaxID=4840 RepID=UPI0037446CED